MSTPPDTDHEAAPQLPGLRGPVIAAALGLVVTGCQTTDPAPPAAPEMRKLPPGSVIYGSPAMMQKLSEQPAPTPPAKAADKAL